MTSPVSLKSAVGFVAACGVLSCCSHTAPLDQANDSPSQYIREYYLPPLKTLSQVLVEELRESLSVDAKTPFSVRDLPQRVAELPTAMRIREVDSREFELAMVEYGDSALIQLLGIELLKRRDGRSKVPLVIALSRASTSEGILFSALMSQLDSQWTDEDVTQVLRVVDGGLSGPRGDVNSLSSNAWPPDIAMSMITLQDRMAYRSVEWDAMFLSCIDMAVVEGRFRPNDDEWAMLHAKCLSCLHVPGIARYHAISILCARMNDADAIELLTRHHGEMKDLEFRILADRLRAKIDAERQKHDGLDNVLEARLKAIGH